MNRAEREERGNAVVADLMDLLEELNAMDDSFAVEVEGCPYGDVKTALISTIASTLLVDRLWAHDVYNAMRDNDMSMMRAHRLVQSKIEAEFIIPAGESAIVSWLLLQTLHELAQLIDTAFYLTVDDHPRWIEIYKGQIHSDVGTMFIEHLRMHYNYNMEEVES